MSLTISDQVLSGKKLEVFSKIVTESNVRADQISGGGRRSDRMTG